MEARLWAEGEDILRDQLAQAQAEGADGAHLNDLVGPGLFTNRMMVQAAMESDRTGNDRPEVM